MEKVDKKAQGKKNRKKGSEWEKIVRVDLESKGWIISKWQNQVEFGVCENGEFQSRNWKDCVLQNGKHYPGVNGRLVPCRMNFRGKGIPMMLGAGFPDFVVYKKLEDTEILRSKSIRLTEFNGEIIEEAADNFFVVLGVEAKVNGYLNPEEREKCQWLLANNIFSKILIAFKNKEGKIEYKEFK